MASPSSSRSPQRSRILPERIRCLAPLERAKRRYGVIKAPGWSVRADRTGWFVWDVDGAGPAVGRIERGDRLLAINGDERYATVGVVFWRHVRAGDTYSVDLEHRGERVSVALPMALAPGGYLDPLFTIYGLVFFASGAALGLLRPRNAHVRLVAECLMLCSFTTLSATWASKRFFVGWEPTVYLAGQAILVWIFPMTSQLSRRSSGRARFWVRRSPRSSQRSWKTSITCRENLLRCERSTRVVQRCLAKDPRDRYGSAAELGSDLVPALARCRDVDARVDLQTRDAATRRGFTV